MTSPLTLLIAASIGASPVASDVEVAGVTYRVTVDGEAAMAFRRGKGMSISLHELGQWRQVEAAIEMASGCKVAHITVAHSFAASPDGRYWALLDCGR